MHILARTTLEWLISINLTLTNYTYPQKHIFSVHMISCSWEKHIIFLPPFKPFGGPHGPLVALGATSVLCQKGTRQKAMVGWTPQVVNWWPINMQSWREARETVLIEGKNKCSWIVSWCASMAVSARFSAVVSGTEDCTVCAALFRTLHDASLRAQRMLSSAWHCLSCSPVHGPPGFIIYVCILRWWRDVRIQELLCNRSMQKFSAKEIPWSTEQQI